MIGMNERLKLLAVAAALCASGFANATLSQASGVFATAPVGSPSLLAVSTVDVSGIQSFSGLGLPGNVIRTIQLEPGAEVTGIGWDVNVTAFAPSWLSEMTIGFGSSSSGFVNLNVGSADANPGTASYSSGGIIDLVGLGFNFNVGADGLLRLEFFESFDDSGISPDGIWNSGTISVQVAAIPEPATYGLMALGLLAVGAAARRRKLG